MIDIEAQIKCVEREIGMRERVYPNWIISKKMSAGKAEYEISMMKQVKRSLEYIPELQELLRKAKGIITAYRVSGNESTYSENEVKDTVHKIDEVLE